MLLHNDDYTTMEFVVHVLKRRVPQGGAGGHAHHAAVHKQDLCMCGVYTAEVAETKVDTVFTPWPRPQGIHCGQP